jgi:hypothetical protein
MLRVDQPPLGHPQKPQFAPGPPPPPLKMARRVYREGAIRRTAARADPSLT